MVLKQIFARETNLGEFISWFKERQVFKGQLSADTSRDTYTLLLLMITIEFSSMHSEIK